MTPYLVTGPAAQPVTLNDMKAHLRVVHSDDDADIESRIASVTAHLDGWGGVLGRCIMPQTWAVDVEGPGPHVLPFPEASDVEATGVAGVIDATLVRGAVGPSVTVSGAATDEPLVVQFVTGLPAARLPAVQSLIKLMVQRDYEPLGQHEAAAMDMSISALMNGLGWRRL